MTRAEHIEACARRLMDLLGKNSGDTADWPIRINADDDISSELCKCLNDLQDAIKQPHTMEEITNEELDAVEKALGKFDAQEQKKAQQLSADCQKSAQQIVFSLDMHIKAFLEKVEGKLPTAQEYADHGYILRSSEKDALFTQYLIWKNQRVFMSRALVDPAGITVKSGELPEEFWPAPLRAFIEHRRAEG